MTNRAAKKVGGHTRRSPVKKRQLTLFQFFAPLPPSLTSRLVSPFTPFFSFLRSRVVVCEEGEVEKSVTRELGARAIKMPRLSTLSSFHSLSLACAKFRWGRIFRILFSGASTSVGKTKMCCTFQRGGNERGVVYIV